MSNQIDLNWCRVCLRASNNISIFGNDIYEKFIFITSVHVKRNDGLPTNLCKSCDARLELAYEFKKQSEDSEKHLRSLLPQLEGDVKTENELDVEMVEVKCERSDYENEMINESETSQSWPGNNAFDDDEDVDDSEDDSFTIEKSRNDPLTNRRTRRASHIKRTPVRAKKTVSRASNESTKPKRTVAAKKPAYVDKDDNVDNEDEDEDADDDSTPGEYEHMCKVCEKLFKTPATLMTHMKLHDMKYKCDVCGHKFSGKGGLKSHMMVHSGEKPYLCDLCPQRFAQKGTMLAHRRTHTGERPFHCSKCGANFRQRETLKRHDDAMHCQDDIIQCKHCKKVFAMKLFLRIHLKYFHVDKTDGTPVDPMTCDICSESYVNEDDLIKHYGDVHPYITSEFYCKMCYKCFKTRDGLGKHVTSHDGKKPYVCELCGKGFTQAGSLKAHMLIHNEEYPFSCSLCPKKFRRNLCLTIHMRVHTGEKPFKCSKCDLTFRIRENLKMHEDTKHIEDLETPPPCNLCGKKFISEYALKRHMYRYHTHRKVPYEKYELS